MTSGHCGIRAERSSMPLSVRFRTDSAMTPMILSEEDKAVLLVVIGHRQKGGVSKRRVGEILGLDASSILDDLLSQGLIYCDPSRELNFWRPTQATLLALGLRSRTDIPALKELEEWFDTQKEMQAIAIGSLL